MDELLIPEFDADLCAAHAHAVALADAYRDARAAASGSPADAFLDRRIAALSLLTTELGELISARDLLPTQIDPEQQALQSAFESLRGAVEGDPCSVYEAGETRLVDGLEKLLDAQSCPRRSAIAAARDAAQAAADEMIRESAGQGDSG